MSKHTPTPWRLTPCGSGSILIECDDEESERSGMTSLICSFEPEDKANAAHIVKCVNLHDEMIEVLENVQTYLAECVSDNASKFSALLNVRAVLSKAKGDV